MALVYEKLGKTDEAIKHYNIALQTKPDYIVALSNLGRVFKNSEMLIEAENVFSKLTKIDNNNFDANYNLAKIQEEIDKEKAVDSYKNLLKIEPNNLEVRNSLADVFLKLGRGEDAINELKDRTDYPE